MVCFFSSLKFYHSIFVTHHSSLITLNTTPVWHHHSISITQYFLHYLWAPYISFIAGFFFPPVPKLTEPSGKKKKKKKKPKTNRSERKKKKKKKKKRKEKKNRTANQEKKRKKKRKKVKSGQKLRLSTVCGSLMCV